MLKIALINIIVPFVFSGLQIPAKPFPETYYPSGNNEADKIYASDKPAKEYPLLKLDFTAYDPEFNKVEPGFYSVEYSPECNMLFMGSGQNIIKSPVFQIIKMDSKIFMPSAKVAFIKDNKVIIIYRNENLEVQSFLYLPEAVLDQN